MTGQPTAGRGPGARGARLFLERGTVTWKQALGKRAIGSPAALAMMGVMACGDDRALVPDGSGVTDTGAPVAYMDCRWQDGGLTVEVAYGDPAGYLLGLAETECMGGRCWTGEDCHLGYTSSGGIVYDLCHPLDPAGGFLITVGTRSKLVEGETTMFAGMWDTTYYLEAASSGSCWVFGHYTSHYRGLGCVDIGGGCEGEQDPETGGVVLP